MVSRALANDVRASPWMTFATVVLGAVGVVYVASGFVNLLGLFGTEGAGDLLKRWVEHAYFVRRISPLEVHDGTHPILPEIGPMHPGSYPPWSLLTGLLLAPPVDQNLLRWYYAGLNLVGLGLTLGIVYQLGRRYSVAVGRWMAASTLAVSANAMTLRHGQYGILVNTMLFGMVVALSRKQPVRGGLLLGMAALKPQISGVFALLWLRKGGLRALITAAAWVAIASALALWWLRQTPLGFLAQVYSQAAAWDGGDNGLLGVALAWGLPRSPVSLGLAVSGVVGTAVLVYRCRDESPLIQAAIAGVFGRLWMYHRRYDDMMLVFLLLALAIEALEQADAKSTVPYGLVGLTLWLPLKESSHVPGVVLAKVAIWLGALAWLVRRADRRQSLQQTSLPRDRNPWMPSTTPARKP